MNVNIIPPFFSERTQRSYSLIYGPTNHVDKSLKMEQHVRVKIERKFSVLGESEQRLRPAFHLTVCSKIYTQCTKPRREESEKLKLL